MAEGTRTKVLDERMSKMEKGLEGVRASLKQTDGRMEILETKLDKTLQNLADLITPNPVPPPATSQPKVATASVLSPSDPPGFPSSSNPPSFLTSNTLSSFIYPIPSHHNYTQVFSSPLTAFPPLMAQSASYPSSTSLPLQYPSFHLPSPLPIQMPTIGHAALPPAPPMSPKSLRVDFPRFNGNDPLDWIYHADRYFDFYQIPDIQKLALASIRMEGQALPWFQAQQRIGQFRSWEEFTRQLETTFEPSEFADPQGTLAKLTQTTTVADYRQRFDASSNWIFGLPPSFLLSCFVSWLRTEIQHEVKSFRRTSLAHSIGLARQQEAELSDQGMSGPPQTPFEQPNPLLNPPNIQTTPSNIPMARNPNLAPSSIVPISRLTPEEMQARRQHQL